MEVFAGCRYRRRVPRRVVALLVIATVSVAVVRSRVGYRPGAGARRDRGQRAELDRRHGRQGRHRTDQHVPRGCRARFDGDVREERALPHRGRPHPAQPARRHDRRQRRDLLRRDGRQQGRATAQALPLSLAASARALGHPWRSQPHDAQLHRARREPEGWRDQRGVRAGARGAGRHRDLAHDGDHDRRRDHHRHVRRLRVDHRREHRRDDPQQHASLGVDGRALRSSAQVASSSRTTRSATLPAQLSISSRSARRW